MNTVLWICQGFLAFVFLYSGVCKSTQSEQWLVTHGQTGVQGLPLPLTRFIGIAELFGVAGIILPWWLQVAPILTPVTALCFAVVMMLAAPIHYKLNELRNSALNITVMLIALFVAWQRFRGI